MTIWQLVIFVGVCGFIAYAGDILGRRMGKRRLTLFGLRPRYTAIIMTTITGMFIAVFTITVMVTASKDVKQLVLQGRQILEEYKASKEAYAEITRQLDAQKVLAEKAQEQTRQAVEERDLRASELAQVTADLGKLRSSLQQSEKALAAARKQLNDAHQQLASANNEIEDRKTEIAGYQEAIASATGDLESLKSDLAQSEYELARAGNELVSAQSRLASATEEIDEHETEIARLKTEIEALDVQRANLERLAETVAEKYLAVRQVPVIFRHNQEIARLVIQCADPIKQIEEELFKLVVEADKRARDEGAKTGSNGRAVEIYPKELGTATGEAIVVKESEKIQALAETISSGSGSVVVVGVAVGNSIEGEQVLVRLLPIRNWLVYSDGQEVASIIIDGSRPAEQVFEDLILFLRNEVRPAAVGKGVIPLYDEEGQPSVGQIGGRQLFVLVEKIKSVGRKVRVKAVATDEIWSSGPIPLPLDLQVGDL